MIRTVRSSLRPLSPHREPAGSLEARTVGRDVLLDAIQRRLTAAANSNTRAHTLLVGPRGAGKSHVISIALHRALESSAGEHLAVARLDEDVVGVRTYPDLLLGILSSMGAPPEVVSALRADRAAAKLEAAIVEELGERTLLVVIENLSRLFEQIGEGGQRDLRSFAESTAPVVLLASTPLLTASIAERSQPWFGSFTVEHLPGLTADEGAELLSRIARAGGDDELVSFLASPRGRQRIAALHLLAGGSPRLWIIFAECATVSAIDELVPAIEELLERLAAYYQQLLWDLPGVEAALIRELATGAPSAPATRLAEAAGVPRHTANTTLRRLEDERWVVGQKIPGTDQRQTWYSLREPMLRHHFQYRSDDPGPLRLIVEVLRAWFDAEERWKRLAQVEPGSLAERHVAASTSLDAPRRSDSGWANADPYELLAEARRWINGQGLGSRTVGAVAEAAALVVTDGPAAALEALTRRRPSAVVDGLGVLLRSSSDSATVGEIIDEALTRGLATDSKDVALLTLVSACWEGRDNPARARDRLQPHLTDGQSDLDMIVREEHAFWTGAAGDHATARDLFAALVDDRTRTLGPDHLDTLAARAGQAVQTGAAGDHATASDLFASLIDDYTRVRGPDHPNTLTARNNYAYSLGDAGDHPTARDIYAALVDDRTRTLGPDHMDTLAARAGHAVQTGAAGDHDVARDLLAALIHDYVRAGGPDHPHTLDARAFHADQTGQSGDHDGACDLWATLIEDVTRALGPDHSHTLIARSNYAYWLGVTGDHATARDLFAALIDARTRALGPDHPDTLTARSNHAHQIAATGDHATARDLFAALIDARTCALGPDDPKTLATRQSHMIETSRAGDVVGAFRLIELIPASHRARLKADLAIDSIQRGTNLPTPDEAAADDEYRSIYPLLSQMARALAGEATALTALPPELRRLVEPSAD